MQTFNAVSWIHFESNNKYFEYRINVERVADDGSSSEVFSQSLPIDRVDPSLLNENEAKVISYNLTARSINFNLGRSRATYSIH